MGIGGGFLRLLSTFFYAVEFCCAAIVLGIYSYFLARLSENHLPISKDWRAVEGLSGVGVLFTIFAVLLTFFLGGVRFFALLAIILDLLFCGAFIATAILTRNGAHSCSGRVITPLGSGNTNTNSRGGLAYGFTTNGSSDYNPSLGVSCRLNTACFAVSVIAAVCFLISAVLQVLVARHHQKEKKYGPGPSNNYTYGSNPRFWRRKSAASKDVYANDVALGAAAPTGLVVDDSRDLRPSADTGYTGTTISPAVAYTGNKVDTGAPGGHHTAYAAAAVNPYGYDKNRTTASNF